MADIILSAGIDIGTTTTQLIFSRLELEKTGGFGCVPKMEVRSREVIYRSRTLFTPLTSEDSIDAEAVAAIIREEYRLAGIRPEELGSGAVIITGESAAKRNARQVIDAIADLAGNFVSAAAGPELESLLAGKGSGACALSMAKACGVLNLDIGGGTSNLCLFLNGNAVDFGCYDIGGRMLRLDNCHRVMHVSPKLAILKKQAIPVPEPGEILTEKQGMRIAEALAKLLAEAAGLLPASSYTEYFETDHGLSGKKRPDIICLSGGVADCVREDFDDPFAFGDLGILLGRAIRACPAFAGSRMIFGDETLRATVIGVGSCAMEVSGSTIYIRNAFFPMKSLPVRRLCCTDDTEIFRLADSLAEIRVRSEPDREHYAIALNGPSCPSFAQIERIADALAGHIRAVHRGIPILTEQDFAKALGQALRRRLQENSDIMILCIDGVSCRDGDFIDIGQPVGDGIALPVVVKTLVFNGNGGQLLET